MGIAASYFDGKTSRRYAVELSHQNGVISITGDVNRICAVGDVRVLERLRSNSHKLAFADGAYLEVSDGAGFDDLLVAIDHRDPIAVRLQRSWRGVLLACCVTLAVLVLLAISGPSLKGKHSKKHHSSSSSSSSNGVCTTYSSVSCSTLLPGQGYPSKYINPSDCDYYVPVSVIIISIVIPLTFICMMVWVILAVT